MQLATIQTNSARVGTCPHGLPLGACPICNGMGGGGGMRKADFSAKPGEMSWNECAAIGAFLKAQANAKAQRQQDIQNYALQLQAFQTAMDSAKARIAQLTQLISNSMPTVIAKPINLIINTIAIGTLNLIRSIPTAISNTLQTIQQKLTDISDKLTAIMGELKTAVEKKISETFNEIKKKVKSLFAIFSPLDAENEDKQIDETKRAFELKTFIHDLYRKLTEGEKDLENNAC
ncbi:hypothetical protein IKU74_05950 [bacterium]|nr:hypothetical protein [bacterium]